MRPRQKRATASARASGTSPTSPWSSTGSNSTTGSSPSTSWLRLRSTQSTSRSPKTVVPVSTCVIALTLGDGAAVDLVEAQHAQLGRRAPQELRDDDELVRILGSDRRLCEARLRQARVELEPPAGRNGARRRDPAARHEEDAAESRLRGRRHEAELRSAQALEPLELRRDGFDGGDAV